MIIEFGHQKIELNGSGALWLPEFTALCVSDLHFEKGSFFGLPPYDTKETLIKLSALIDFYQPQIVISLGDSFHDTKALSRISEDDAAFLNMLMLKTGTWVWVEGNHDPAMEGLVPGLHCADYQLGDICFRHIATKNSEWEISGHYHPKAKVSLNHASVRAPCFVLAHQKLIVPAFGTYTGGLDVTNQAFRDAVKEPYMLYLLHQGKVYPW